MHTYKAALNPNPSSRLRNAMRTHRPRIPFPLCVHTLWMVDTKIKCGCVFLLTYLCYFLLQLFF